jgi:hypothetical protein
MNVHNPVQEKPRRFEILLFIPWALGTLEFSINVLGTRLFLIYLYGWTKVRREHLHILSMPKGHDWLVSNGEVIKSGFVIHYLISLVCWFALFFATYLSCADYYLAHSDQPLA